MQINMQRLAVKPNPTSVAATESQVDNFIGGPTTNA